MKPLSTKSYNWVFNSFNSAGAILYEGIRMRADLDNNSIPNSNSCCGDRLDKSLGNTFENSRITSTISKVTFEDDLRPHTPCVVISLPLKPRSHTCAKPYCQLQTLIWMSWFLKYDLLGKIVQWKMMNGQLIHTQDYVEVIHFKWNQIHL